MIANAKVSLISDRMNCEFLWVFGALELLPANEKLRVFNLSDPKLESFMMFARGSADPHSGFLQCLLYKPIELTYSTANPFSLTVGWTAVSIY